MNVESELKNIINRLYDIQDVSGPDLSKKIYEIILQCREAIGYRKAELDRVQSSRKSIKSDSDWHARNNYQNKEIYREAFASLVKDSDAQDFDNSPYGTVHYPGFYRVLVDGTYETEFSAETDEEAIQKFKDYFAESRGINNSKKPIKSSNLPKEVYYIVINGAKQYFEDREKAKEMAAELGVGSVYTETDPEEIQELYEVGYISNSRKPIKSSQDTSTEDTSNDYGFYWNGDDIYDKDGFRWYFGDYTNGNTGIEPYSSYIVAVKETADSIRDAFTEDEIPDPEDYAYQLVDFAVETLPDPGKFIKEYEGF